MLNYGMKTFSMVGRDALIAPCGGMRSCRPTKVAFLLSMFAAFAYAAPDPMIAITPVTRSMEQTGGTAAINTSGSGTWKASVSDNWILLTSSSGTAGYPVGYTVSANNNVETRIGYVYVSGYTHTITQSGLGATLGSYLAEFERAGGSGIVQVNAPSGKTWHAKSNASWITVSASSGTGTRALNFTVAPYDEVSTRSGTLTVADNTFTVYQTGRRMQLKSYSATTDYFAETIKIRVNALAPGFFIGKQNRSALLKDDGSLTDRSVKVIAKTPMGRFGDITELNGAAQFLCSDAASFITGVVLPVDGGFSTFSGV